MLEDSRERARLASVLPETAMDPAIPPRQVQQPVMFSSGRTQGVEKLTYEKVTDDLAALLDHLKTGSVDVLGGVTGPSRRFFSASDIRRRPRRSWRWRPTSIPATRRARPTSSI